MKRSREQITRDILALLAREGAQGKTQIVYGCGLAFQPAGGYLADLEAGGQVVAIAHPANGRRHWHITEKGRTTLRHLAAVMR